MISLLPILSMSFQYLPRAHPMHFLEPSAENYPYSSIAVIIPSHHITYHQKKLPLLSPGPLTLTAPGHPILT